ncbi:hypothetical protein OEV98_04450 [Caldibacillus lycopersici]|uniref:Uncharacterized protein n=1 Tax=Perspicuibacillus lycopersici TaxID=1325689 RepID=A0AAE3ISF4_9BACI|nr:hypothetical protein [Perspicuibacillus lycopersici]MCU9612798.1 hypothetical protein [Perspicuibacillus lycopersici]
MGKNDEHIAGYIASLGNRKPEYIVHTEGGIYEVKAVKYPQK